MQKTNWSNHQDKLARLYEKGAATMALREYERLWRILARSGMKLIHGWENGLVFDEFSELDFLENKLL